MIDFPFSSAVSASAKPQSHRPADRLAIGIVMLAAIVGTQLFAWLTV
jgi:hypothetical protein